MIRYTLLFLLGIALVGCSSTKESTGEVDDSSYHAEYVRGIWNGRLVPNQGICTRQGGSGKSPAIRVFNPPEGAQNIFVEFIDETSGRNHGSWSVPVGNNDKFTIHSVDEGRYGYIGPCSGGRGNLYKVNLTAQGPNVNKTISLSLGRY